MSAILGGSGSLGRELQKHLVAHPVYGKQKLVNLDRSAHPENLPEFSFVQCDISAISESDLCPLMKDIKRIFWCVTPDVQHATAKDMENTNVFGLQKVVNASKTAGVKSFVFVSSLAVTNHYLPAHNMKESDPLPDWKTYVSTYDITKRKGEEFILQQNSNNFRTTAIRCGCLLACHTDYQLRRVFSSNTVFIFGRAKIDQIGSIDFSTALVKAAEKLDADEYNDDVCGKAFFVTRGKESETPTLDKIQVHLSKTLNWPISYDIPPWIAKFMTGVFFLKYKAELLLGTIKEPLAVAPHKFLEIPFVEQTFDNSLGRRMLGFEPQESWQDAVERIVKNFREHQKTAGIVHESKL